MSLLQDTKSIQSKLALFCRTGEKVNLPGVKPGRIEHYRKLIFNILLENLEAAFPITHQYTENSVWREMVHQFFSRHNCRSYQVWEIAGEFCEFAIKENFSECYRIPCLNDLLKFEWEEMRIYNMEHLTFETHNSEGAFLTDQIVFNPEHNILHLQFPVHLYNPAEANSKKGQYFALLYRDPGTGNVQFIDLSVWFAIVVEQITTQKLNLQDLIAQAPTLFGNINLEHLKVETLNFLEEMRKQHFLLGFKRSHQQ